MTHSPSWAGAPITQGFGPTNEKLDGAYQGYSNFNKGIDFSLAVGTPIDIPVGGVVVHVDNDPNAANGWGRQVWVQDDQGNVHQFGHLDTVAAPVAKVGTRVEAGALVGTSGNTGKSTGPHLSYDVKNAQGEYFDPSEFIGVSASQSGASGGGTSAGQPLSSSTGLSGDDLKQLEELQRHADALWDTVLTGQDLDGLATEQLGMVLDQIENIRSRAIDVQDTSDKRAQTAFQNAIDLGDYEGREADRRFNRWMDRRDAAQKTAQAEINNTIARNEHNMALKSARFENQGQGPRESATTYLPGKYEDTLGKWEGKFGVGKDPGRTYDSGLDPVRFTDAMGPSHASGPPPGVVRNPNSAMDYRLGDPHHPFEQNKDENFTPFNRGPGGAMTTPSHTGETMNPNAVPNARLGSWQIDPRTGRNRTGAFGDYWDRLAGAGRRIGGSLLPRIGFERGTTSFPDGQAFNPNAKWWQQSSDPPMRFAGGTRNAPGGKAMVGEKGPETEITPDGQVRRIGEYGPEVRDIQQGSMILPNEVGPDEALIYSQIVQAGQRGSRKESPAAQRAREADPQLRQKVEESMLRAIAANDATDPPFTPTLVGDWPDDPWKDLRALSAPTPEGT